MTHELNIALFVATCFYTIVTGTIAIMLTIKRYQEKIKALDYLIAIFGLISFTGVTQVLTPLLHDFIFIFSLYTGVNDPLALNPVRNLGLLIFLILYIFAEHNLGLKPNFVRFSIAISSLIGYMLVFVYFINTQILIHMDDLIPFMQHTRLDEFFYDILLLQSLILLYYNFRLQYKQSVNVKIKKNLRLILIGIGLFLATYFIEIGEHFFPIPDIDFVFFTIPMFLIFGYVYIRNPNFVYYTPIDIHLLQISTLDGHLLYATEFESRISTNDYLISIGLSGLNSMVQEIVNPNPEQITINSIKFENGILLFEKIGNLIAIIHAGRETYILRRSIKYFIREFERQFGNKIRKLEGGVRFEKLTEVQNLLAQCIPIIQSKITVDPSESNYIDS